MPMPEGMTLEPFSQVWFAGVLEFYGGALLVLGLCTRPVAFLLSGLMAVAYFQSHAPNGFWPLVNGGSDAVLYCFVWLYFAAAGAGPWSLDAAIGRARGGRALSRSED
jgi:putative oxidoreductase